MTWIDRIDWVGNRLVPIARNEDGAEAPIPLAKLKNHLPPRQNQVAHLTGLDLQELSAVDPSEYFSEFGAGTSGTLNHDVFAFQFDGRRHLVPAAVLLSGLLLRLSAYADRLFIAGSLDGIAQPMLQQDAIGIRFSKGSALRDVVNIDDLRRLFTWLTCFRSGRKFWASIYDRALTGALGFVPPSAKVNLSVYGHTTRAGVFITRVVLKALTPTEGPLPFAAGKAPDTFLFAQSKSRAAAENLRLTKLANRYRPRVQGDIPRGPAGWAMTDTEWRTVLGRLKVRGFVCSISAKANIDRALEKHGSGELWGTGTHMSSAQTAYSHWNLDGRWEALKAELKEIRGAAAAAAPSTSLSGGSTESRKLIRRGPAGWAMSNAEWAGAMKTLRADGLPCRPRSKANLDIALEKYGAGKTWDEVAPDDSAPPALHSMWNRDGRWDALLTILDGYRRGPDD